MSWGGFQNYFFKPSASVSTAAPVSALVSMSPLDWSYRGEPFVRGAPSAAIDFGSMDYVYHGEPFTQAVH